MCGRAKLPLDYSEIKLKLDDLAPPPNWPGSWNLAPTQDMLAVVRDPLTGRRVSVTARWGLIPEGGRDSLLPLRGRRWPSHKRRSDEGLEAG